MKKINIEKPVVSMSRNGKLFFNISEQRLGYVINEKEVLLYGSWGQARINPRNWIDAGSLREKVFLRPDEPMRLIGNFVEPERAKTQSLFQKSEEEKIKEMAQQGVFG